jgi:hypothetical protein
LIRRVDRSSIREQALSTISVVHDLDSAMGPIDKTMEYLTT